MATWSTQTATREYQIAANGELTVVERLANLLETGQFADVTITVGEGDDVVTFKAHRLLLATASKSLNNLVSSNLKNGPGEGVAIRVTDVDPEAFQHLLKYIYTDDLKINNPGECVTLLKLGQKWELQNLVGKTIKYVHSFLDEYEPICEERKNELCDLLAIAEEFEMDLQEKCWAVLLKNVNEVVPCQGFLNMSKEMVRRLLHHKDFQFKNQLVLFEAIRDWGMNQVLQKNLNVNNLKGLIGEFLNLIDFKGVSDSDFLDTIIPSDCLGKAELISLFMTRGLAIPRDLSYNNNNIQNSMPYEKFGRYEKGYKLSKQEVYKEHELRFRVDKKLLLLGVGFGFLFSNTDMGITVHCQGPWEVRQWQDIIQTYCRVTYEKMKTADVRLMFSEPVNIEANHSYKILVRVGRMSAGSSDVELWGGTQGTSRVKIKDAEISFLKAAVHPSKQVEDSDTENKPGMITDLYYELDDGKKKISTLTPSSPSVPSAFSPFKQRKIQNAPTFSQPLQPNKKKSVESSTSPKIYATPISPKEVSSPTGKENVVDNVAPPESQIGSTSASNYSFRRNVPSARIDINPPSPTQPKSSPPTKKTHVDEASSYYLTNRPSNIRGSETLPSYMRNRQPSVEKKQSWCIPSRSKTTSSMSSFFNSFKHSRPSKDRDSPVADTGYSGRRQSKPSILFENTSLSKSPYNYGVSNIKSKYESSLKNDPYSRKTFDTPSKYAPGSSASSRYTKSSQVDKPDMRYTTTGSGSHLGSNTDASEGFTTSRYGSGYRGREKTTSPSRYGRKSPSLYRQTASSQNTGRDTGLNRSSGITSPLGTSRYGTGSSSTQGTSRYGTPGTSSSLGTSKYESTGSSSSQGTSRYGTPGTSSSLGTSKYDTTGSSSSLGTSRYGTPGTSSSLGTSSRYGSSTASNATGSSGRYGSSNIGTSRSGTTPSRYGSSSLSNTSTTSTLSPRHVPSSGSSTALGSRYGSASSSTPSYLSSSRFGTSSPIGSNYSGGSTSNRFGSSLYRR